MKKESYHLFKVRGDSFVYCPSSGLFFSISPLAFEALSILKSSNNQNILHQLIEKGYDTEDIKSFNQELSLLAENGLFGQKKNIVNVKERIRIIEQKIIHTEYLTCNSCSQRDATWPAFTVIAQRI